MYQTLNIFAQAAMISFPMWVEFIDHDNSYGSRGAECTVEDITRKFM